MKKQLIIFAIILIFVAAGSFYGGLQYGQSKNKTNSNSFAQRLGQNGNGNRALTGSNGLRNSSFISGEILNKDDKSLTIKLRDGGSKIVFYSNKTQVVKNSTSTIDTLQVGDSVMANGSTNSDGSLNAESIQLGNGNFFGGPNPNPNTGNNVPPIQN